MESFIKEFNFNIFIGFIILCVSARLNRSDVVLHQEFTVIDASKRFSLGGD